MGDEPRLGPATRPVTEAGRRRLIDGAIVAACYLALLLLGASLPSYGVMILAGAIVGIRDGRLEAVWIGALAGGVLTGFLSAVLATHRLGDLGLGAVLGAITALALVMPGFLFGRAVRAWMAGDGAMRGAILVAAGVALLVAGTFVGILALLVIAGPLGP